MVNGFASIWVGIKMCEGGGRGRGRRGRGAVPPWPWDRQSDKCDRDRIRPFCRRTHTWSRSITRTFSAGDWLDFIINGFLQSSHLNETHLGMFPRASAFWRWDGSRMDGLRNGETGNIGYKVLSLIWSIFSGPTSELIADIYCTSFGKKWN